MKDEYSDILLKLHTNQRLLLTELINRGAKIELIQPELELIEVEFKGRKEFLLDRDSSIVPYSGALIAADKYLTKKLLRRAGISTPKGEQFIGSQKDDAIWCVRQSFKYPLVLKPSKGSHGENCFTDINDEGLLEESIDIFIAENGADYPFLIEEQVNGDEYRIFITQTGAFAALRREPASITGDGINTIRKLTQIESERRMNPRINSLCPIVLDKSASYYLSLQGLSFNSIIPKNSKIFLRRNSNIATGGIPIDVTDKIHPSLVEIALKSMKTIYGIPYAGIDILTEDISAIQNSSSYAVLEVNTNPGLHMHHRPGEGQGRDVASYLADVIFPESVL